MRLLKSIMIVVIVTVFSVGAIALVRWLGIGTPYLAALTMIGSLSVLAYVWYKARRTRPEISLIIGVWALVIVVMCVPAIANGG